MKRLIYLSIPEKQKPIDGFYTINPNGLDDVINYSVDHMHCDCLEYLPKNIAKTCLDMMCNKIRPDGLLTLTISNIKHICRNYYMNNMDDDTLLGLIHGRNSIFSIQSISDSIQRSGDMKILKIEISVNQLEMVITSQRVKI